MTDSVMLADSSTSSSAGGIGTMITSTLAMMLTGRIKSCQRPNAPIAKCACCRSGCHPSLPTMAQLWPRGTEKREARRGAGRYRKGSGVSSQTSIRRKVPEIRLI